MGKLTAFPESWVFARKKPNLVCLHEREGIVRVVVCRTWEEVDRLQEDPANSGLAWCFMSDWDSL